MAHETDQRSIVCFGGGSGLPELLRGLKMFGSFFDITAVVTMFDSGGSSGEILREHGARPSGDLRRCFEALSTKDPKVLELLGVRLNVIGQHTLANLMMYGLESILGKDYEKAIDLLGRALEVEGRVLPVSTDKAQLSAEFENGFTMTGEDQIDQYMNDTSPIRRLWINPSATVSPSVVKAINDAEFLCIGPGSFYTSVLANLLPQGIKETISQRSAAVIYVANLLTEGLGMQGMTLRSCVSIIEEHIGREVDYIIANDEHLSEMSLETYAVQHKYPLEIDEELWDDKRCRFGSLWMSNKEKARRQTDIAAIRHDPRKLAAMIFKITHP